MITTEKPMGSGWQYMNAGKQSGRQWIAGAPVCCFLAMMAVVVLMASDAVSGSITIAGNGPQLRVFDRLTRAFEKKPLCAVAEIQRDSSFQPIAMVAAITLTLAFAR